MSWKSTETYSIIHARAKLLAQLRSFFAQRKVLEVETPILMRGTIPDPNIHSFTSRINNTTLYLQTSPEFAMKRLLAAGSGSIYQICKAFRKEECGKLHNPEFTILEWYRINFNHHQLMRETDELLQNILSTKPAEKITYQAAFQRYLNIDPLKNSINSLRACALKNGLNDIPGLDYNEWLNILLTHFIEPHLGQKQPTFIYNFPASQSALAKINENIAERFEVYVNGVELANGFHELTNHQEQRRRFIREQQKRRQQKLPLIPLDEEFLSALERGLPNCAGIALGVDRLLMLKMCLANVQESLAFSLEI